MKRYQFELNGEIIYKNVSPENEQMFFNKYGKYNPTLVSEEPGKPQGTSQSQQNQEQTLVEEDMDSSSEPGSLELQKFESPNFNRNSGTLESKIASGEATEEEKLYFINNYDKSYKSSKGSELAGMKDGGFWEDIWTSMVNGWENGKSVEEAFDIWTHGKNISGEELRDYINVVQSMDEQQRTHEELSYQASVEKHGTGFLGGLVALLENPGYIPQFIVQSGAQMVSTLESEEAWASMVAHAGAYATGAVVAGQLGPQVGAPEELVTVPLAAVGGGFGGLTAAMETGLTTTELLKEELGDLPMTEDNIRAILEDPYKMWNIRSRAAATGLVVGNIEAMGMILSGGTGGVVAKGLTGAATKPLTKFAVEMGINAFGEAVTGFGSEVAGQVAKGGERAFDMEAEINYAEAWMEAAGFPQDVAVSTSTKGLSHVYTNHINPAIQERKGNYKLNGEATTMENILKTIGNENITAYERIKIAESINIKGDNKFQGVIDKIKNRAILDTQIDPKITGLEDRKKLLDLHEKRARAEADTKKTGIFRVANADKILADINSQIDELITPYEAVDTEVAGQQVAEQTLEKADV